MANKAVEQLKRKRARKIKAKFKSFFRAIFILILSCFLLCVVSLGALIISDVIETNREIQMLSDAGLYNLVEIDDGRHINVASYGNVEANHTIVPISGIGIQDYTVFMQHIGANIKETTRIAFIDRAGYGFSDDSNKPQTVEQIISDYRTALKKAGIDGPYVLVAHEFGSVYATYWSLQYPEEVEGILYLDGTEIIESNEISSTTKTDEDVVRSFLYKIGFQRLSYDSFFNASARTLTKQESECSRSLNANSVLTMAFLSERELMKENFDIVLNMIEKTDIPKLYLCSQNAFSYEKDVIKYYEYKNRQNQECGLPPFYELGYDTEQVSRDAAQFIEECKQRYQNKTMVFVDTLGNCKIAKMPGDYKIYEQKTEGLVDVIVDFMEYLDGKQNSIKAYYEDTKAIDWDKYLEEHKAEVTQPTTETKKDIDN